MDFWNTLIFHMASFSMFLLLALIPFIIIMFALRVGGRSTKKTVRTFKK